MNEHKKVHTGGKLYVCKKTFNQVITSKNHERTHIGKKLYVCDVCKKTLNQFTNLRHIKKVLCGAQLLVFRQQENRIKEFKPKYIHYNCI